MANMSKNTSRNYFSFLLKNNMRFMLLYGFGLLIAFPILCASLNYTTNIEGLYYVGKVLNLLIAIVATVIIPLLLLKYTTSKNSLDVFHSLPIRKESLFVTNYLAGIVMLLLPFAISWFGGIFLSLLLGYHDIVIFTEFVNFFRIALALLVSYSITIFAKNNCGTILDAFIYTIALNLIPLLAYVTYLAYCNDVLLGFGEDFSSNVFFYLTPFPAMFVYAFESAIGVSTIVPNQAMWLYGLVIAICFVFSAKFYLNLKSEKTDIAFTNDYFYPIVSFISTMIAIILIHTLMNSAFNYYGMSSYVFPLLVGTIFYLILDVIANRGFKHITKSLLRIAVICLVVLAILIPVKTTNGFGYITRTPKIDNIDSVKIQLGYPLNNYLLLSSNQSMTFDDEQSKKTILDLHHLILEEYRKVNYESDNPYDIEDSLNTFPINLGLSYNTLSIDYDLGLTHLKRNYNTFHSWTYSLLSLATTKPMVEARYPMIARPSEYSIKRIFLSDVYNNLGKYLDVIDFSKLAEALQVDLNNETTDQFFEDHDTILGYFSIESEVKNTRYSDTTTWIPLKSHYTNTLAYLASLQISVPEAQLERFSSLSFYAVIPDENSSNAAFYFGNQIDYGMKDLYDMNYFTLSYEEFVALEPYMHSSQMTKEPNILIYFNYNGEIKERMVRYKDLGILNTIVQGREASHIDDLSSLLYNSNY